MMNYLAHLYLADANGGSLIGQVLGDFIKGLPDRRLGDVIREGIHFHRRIDGFADTHPAVRTSRRRFSIRRRRFAGILVDLCHDHFLARHWRDFSAERLDQFTGRIYETLGREARCPAVSAPPGTAPPAWSDRVRYVLGLMIRHDWLGQYIHLDKVGLALDRIAQRLSRGERFMGGIEEIRVHYRDLEGDFLTFFPEMIAFAAEYADRSDNSMEMERK